MNSENINLIRKKYPGWFEGHVSCNLYHDPVTDQMNQYPVFTIRFSPLMSNLAPDEVIESDLTSHSPQFVEHVEGKIEHYIDYICEKALK